ncbi:hypothetical protein CEP54_007555 [Fusarium duplospermum]|uniref:Uncharacterized protein n=1 Tax=Fusarium duplospermum TaxID=1325734 RepID=A0A428Q0K7_9HYPO|nr:hypothetical protein CEP54_007555 [Fusarium duplospermum]
MAKLIQVRTKSGNPDRTIRDLVEGNSAYAFLPSPLIFPPMYMLRGTEELADKLREKLGDSASVEVLQDIDE